MSEVSQVYPILAQLSIDAWSVLLSACLFVSVVLAVVALFRSPGEVHVADERAAAIASGQSDRQTVFERPMGRPLMQLLLAVSHRLAMPVAKRWLGRTLIASGNPNWYTVDEYLALSLGAGLAGGLFGEAVHVIAYGGGSVMVLTFGFAAGIFLTVYRLHNQASKRIMQISKQLPYSLDLIALAMGAGATFTEALRTVVRPPTGQAEGLKQIGPFEVELRTLLAEMDLGTTRRQAMENLAQRVPLEPLRSIVASVIQSEQLGTPMGDVLHDQATLLRLRRSFSAENKAAVASVRVLVPCLLLVVAVILAVFGPAIVRVVRGGLL